MKASPTALAAAHLGSGCPAEVSRIMKPSRHEWAIAHHEAGHAVAASSVGMTPRNIAIVADNGTAEGLYTHQPYFAGLKAGWEHLLTPAAQRRLENRALVCLAGGAAQRRFDPDGFRWEDCQGDHDQMTAMLLVLTDGDLGDEFVAYWKLIEVRANNFVSSPANWYVIRAVARSIVKNKQLRGRAVSAAISAASDAYAQRRMVRGPTSCT